ncbi:MAG: pyridoxamine 5'-phosphate oxidase [Bryobacteraceae bacterium]|nr:pyridoxamine 5'-phosphate oxidase [Bryobacteraceae bacterium]
MDNFALLRESYTRGGLLEDAASSDPWVQFESWFQEAVSAGLREPNAMTLATATPNARIVLMKGYSPDGVVFYTNYESAKGREIEANPCVALLFFWRELERQVRIRGTAARISREETLAYFRSRPPGSQMGAAISPQSQVIPDRAWLESRLASMGEGEVALPENWGGFRVRVSEFEFWQGRPCRLHDRLRYRLAAGAWVRERLAP